MASPPDLAVLLRRVKPEKTLASIPLRLKADLFQASDVTASRQLKLIPDANILIDNFAGRLKQDVINLLDAASIHHCSVCLAEIMSGLGDSDPTHPRWRRERDTWTLFFGAMLPARVHTPDRDTWVEAGLLAGTLARVQRYGAQEQRKALNDALLYLTAKKVGIPVLTANRKDFDRLQQMSPAPGATVIFA